MRRTVLVLLGLVALLAILAAVAMRVPAVQDALLARGLAAGLAADPEPPPPGGLRVFMCGTAAPLPTPDRAQACVIVQADDRLVLIDAGARSDNVANLAGLPLGELRLVLITHFHSDHIAALQDFALVSWVQGRTGPLPVAGPAGIDDVVGGLNRAYAADRGYRVTHHGADLLPPDAGTLTPRTLAAGETVTLGDLTIRAFAVDHDPVRPALGYRLERGGRSVVVTGDTVITDGVLEGARSADLVLTDALSPTLVRAMESAATEAGRSRLAKIFHDIQDYHADAGALARFSEEAGAGLVAAYHLVPAPRNALMARIFARDLPDDVLMTDDGMVFDLPAASDAIEVRGP